MGDTELLVSNSQPYSQSNFNPITGHNYASNLSLINYGNNTWILTITHNISIESENRNIFTSLEWLTNSTINELQLFICWLNILKKNSQWNKV